MTRIVEGGINIPSVPPTASIPALVPTGYPREVSSGRQARPMVAVVATLLPHTAPNTVQPTIAPCASPPRRCPRKAFAASNRSRARPPRSISAPIRMNSGIVVSV